MEQTEKTEREEDGKQRVRSSLHALIRLFESGEAPQALTYSALPRPNIPASTWSLCNNLLLWINGTGDARGFRQWQEVGRHVVKGAKAIYILAPTFCRAKSCKEKRAAGGVEGGKIPGALHGEHATEVQSPSETPLRSNPEPRLILAGFRAVPVFRFEDTAGEPLQNGLDPVEPPALKDVAEKWGMTVRYVGCSGPYLGYYRHSASRPCEITLATHEEQVFFHELAHAAQFRVWTDLKPTQQLRKEVAAELAACVLARLYGRKSANEGGSYEYIKHFCESEGKALDKTLWGLVSDAEKILDAILQVHHEAQRA